MQHNTWCALHNNASVARGGPGLSFPRPIGEGGWVLAQQQRPLTRGFLWLCAGLHPAWTREVGVDKQVCSELMWAQLMPAGHETGVFPGVLPRLRVALVFPTQALGHERLALRCNSNKSPNHLIASEARDEDAHHFLIPAACPPRGTPPAQLAELPSKPSLVAAALEGACVPAASSRERWGHGSRQEHGLACRLPRVVDANGWRSMKVTAMAFRSRATHQRWLAGPSPHGPGMMAATGAGAGRGCRRLDPKWPSCVVEVSFDRRRSSLTGSPSLHCYPRYAVECR